MDEKDLFSSLPKNRDIPQEKASQPKKMKSKSERVLDREKMEEYALPEVTSERELLRDAEEFE